MSYGRPVVQLQQQGLQHLLQWNSQVALLQGSLVSVGAQQCTGTSSLLTLLCFTTRPPFVERDEKVPLFLQVRRLRPMASQVELRVQWDLKCLLEESEQRGLLSREKAIILFF
jgi:hypothetical protein